MKILSMTATFGKLENQTLTLKPGLNILSAPNEWGKSTWCAFLATMLYGLDTREKTTKTALAVKERYAPWSGSPMSGRMDICWNGRNITIERWTKGRTPMGEFRAYETESGLPVVELTGTNCGEVLLGVEKSVFLRAGFLRLSDLPVTADESLRRRLNALVTTGDESGAADELGQKLKDLKNKVRYNRSGLLPQAEAQRNEVQAKLSELQTLRSQSQTLQQRLSDAEAQMAQLKNHQAALEYAAAQEDIQRVKQAHIDVEIAAEALANAEARCLELPSRDTAKEELDQHALLLQEQANLVQAWNALSPEPQPPQAPERYRGMDPADAIAEAEEDVAYYTSLGQAKKKPLSILLIFAGFTALLVLIGILINNPYAWMTIGSSIVLLGISLLIGIGQNKKRWQKEREDLIRFYGGLMPDRWIEDATLYAESVRQYEEMLQHALAQRRDIRQRMDGVEENFRTLMGTLSSRDFLLNRNAVIDAHDALADAHREHQQKAAHAATLGAMVKKAEAPALPDQLTCSEAETVRALADLEFETKQLQLRLGQYQGRMDVLGAESALQSQLDAIHARIQKLSQYYDALELAQQTLEKATQELQRRFAPRISQQAQEIFSQLTLRRYERLNLQQDLSINAATTDEVAMRSAIWRSEGTIDQLYLALRLAVARELTPTAPLVLDDALVRFDDARHAAAMDILRQESQDKQVILFTCQSREQGN
ncbi:MAG: AAA family ATPase [Oscillospiraceae bacterium]|nr:AAA family ATPase [Oscillospiraceae bacterium]